MLSRWKAVMAVVALASAADAAVLCQKKSGAVVVREPACKKRETALDLSQFVAASKAPDSEMLDGIDSTGFLQAGGKAADADTLDGIDAASFLQSDGLILVTASHKEWVAQTGSIVSINHSRNVTAFGAPGAAADQFIGVGPALPSALYGRRVELVGVEVCYTASATAVIDTAYLTVYDNSTPGFPTGPAVVFSDATNRTDDVCRVYNLPTPFALTGEEFVEFSLSVDYGAAATFYIGRTTFIMNATTLPATAPSVTAGHVATLASAPIFGPYAGELLP